MKTIDIRPADAAKLIMQRLRDLKVAGFTRSAGSNGARARHPETGVEIRAEVRPGLDGEGWALDASISLGGRDHTAEQARAVAGALMVAADAVSELNAEFRHLRVTP